MTTYAELLVIAQEATNIATDMLRAGEPGAITVKGDRDMATELDVAIERRLRAYLAERAPGVAFLGEEEGGPDAGDGLCWALDPIDGTVNFLHGHPLVCVSLALLANRVPVVGVIAAPFLERRYWAVQGEGAFKNGKPIRARLTNRLSDAVVAIGDYAVGEDAASRNEPRYALTRSLAAEVQRVRMHGSAAVDLAWLADGTIDAAIMLVNHPWDVSAGVIIAREAGALVLDEHGRPHTDQAAATIAVVPPLRDELLRLLPA